MKVKVISLPYIFQVLYVLCFTRPRYQVSVYRTIGPLVLLLCQFWLKLILCLYQAQMSGECLQDHWSSGFTAMSVLVKIDIVLIPGSDVW